MSQNGNLAQVGVKIRNIWNHHLVFHVRNGLSKGEDLENMEPDGRKDLCHLHLVACKCPTEEHVWLSVSFSSSQRVRQTRTMFAIPSKTVDTYGWLEQLKTHEYASHHHFFRGADSPCALSGPCHPQPQQEDNDKSFRSAGRRKKKHNGCSTTISSSYWLPILVRIDICSHQAQGFAKEVVCQLFSAVVRVMKHPLEDNIRRRQGGQTWSSMQTRTWWLG